MHKRYKGRDCFPAFRRQKIVLAVFQGTKKNRPEGRLIAAAEDLFRTLPSRRYLLLPEFALAWELPLSFLPLPVL